ncbi:hypothetical protein C1T17_05665 [Sphingobium sp. SCG-1]|uniref:hypothetical protein n=1 Tax=Sphingobium sp. SCG-1 TaxID=2072936 RepID=UPI000CD69CD3|nr:hypothetical protein [Sphingobium sp. SCG-1]AUW57667.1 hypothetical protein C1T17_05665 [Sphingobium sp. SCG-1]
MKILPLATLALLMLPASVLAQDGPASPPAAVPAGTDNEKVNLVIVYGDDPCPKTAGDELVVCGRKEEKERYRIPEPLRGDPNAPANQAWGQQYKSLEYVGKSGIDSCSPSGIGGFTGCFNQLARNAKAEKQQAKNASWGDLVAAERAKRLSTIDAQSDAIEARVKAEEAAAKKDAPVTAPN